MSQRPAAGQALRAARGWMQGGGRGAEARLGLRRVRNRTEGIAVAVAVTGGWPGVRTERQDLLRVPREMGEGGEGRAEGKRGRSSIRRRAPRTLGP